MRIKKIGNAFLAVLIGATFGAAVSAPQTSASKTHLRVRALPDCEDMDGKLKGKCITFDEGKWRVVSSYRPYKSVVINVCSVPLSRKIPCVIKKPAKPGVYYILGKK